MECTVQLALFCGCSIEANTNISLHLHDVQVLHSSLHATNKCRGAIVWIQGYRFGTYICSICVYNAELRISGYKTY